MSLLHHQVTSHQIHLSALAGYTSSHEQYYINIYAQRTTKLSTPMIKSFVTLKMLIQNERTWWFTVWTLRSTFAQGIVRVGYTLPPFFYYELLFVWKYTALGESLVKNIALGKSTRLHLMLYLSLNSHLELYTLYKLAAVLQVILIASYWPISEL